ncbi:hypothetical protein HDU81_009865, partial [Chytriomyces hyalinus]
MVTQLAKTRGSHINAEDLIKAIDDAIIFSANAKAFLATVSNVSSEVTETIDHVMATIDGIASAHPILKLSWFVVSAGYKMVKDASEVYHKYLELLGRLQTILECVADFLKLPITGIKDDKTRITLVKASGDIILCLMDAAILFTKYINNPSTTLGNLFFRSNKESLDQMNERLASVQHEHKIAKDNGQFVILVGLASDMGHVRNDMGHVRNVLDNAQEMSKDVEYQSQ